jgi:hypothetical protein
MKGTFILKIFLCPWKVKREMAPVLAKIEGFRMMLAIPSILLLSSGNPTCTLFRCPVLGKCYV